MGPILAMFIRLWEPWGRIDGRLLRRPRDIRARRPGGSQAQLGKGAQQHGWRRGRGACPPPDDASAPPGLIRASIVQSLVQLLQGNAGAVEEMRRRIALRQSLSIRGEVVPFAWMEEAVELHETHGRAPPHDAPAPSATSAPSSHSPPVAGTQAPSSSALGAPDDAEGAAGGSSAVAEARLC